RPDRGPDLRRSLLPRARGDGAGAGHADRPSAAQHFRPARPAHGQPDRRRGATCVPAFRIAEAPARPRRTGLAQAHGLTRTTRPESRGTTTMRIATVLTSAALGAALSALLAASPALAQLPPQLAIGQYEVKAYQAIPKAKVAVQLTQDTALGRHLRGKVMERLAKRGMEVGFSGGNVMRMDVA